MNFFLKSLGPVVLPLLLAAGIAGATEAPILTDALDTTGNGLQTTDGLKGKAAVVGTTANGQNLSRNYNRTGGVLRNSGTVMFWLRPLDWDSSNKGNVTFFTAAGKDGTLQLYKYPDYGNQSGYSNKLLFLFGDTRKNAQGQAQWKIAATPSRMEFQSGEWYFLAAVWNEKTMTLYVDGKPVVTENINTSPEYPFQSFQLGNPVAPAATTAIDELAVYDRALGEAEIYRRYEATRPIKLSAVRTLTVGKAATSPRLDGKIENGEYTFSGTGMLEIGNQGRFAVSQSGFYLSYDNNNLYVALKTPGGKLQANGNNAIVCWDDAIEIYVSPQNRRNAVYHWIVNSAGTVYSEKNQDSGWKTSQFRFQNRIAADGWYFEAVIPFAAIDAAPPRSGETWGINLCRTFTSPKVTYTSLGPSTGSYAAGIIPVTLRDDAPPYGVALDGNLNTKEISLRPVADQTATLKFQLRNAAGKVIADQNKTGQKLSGFGDRGELALAVEADGRTLYAATWQFFPVSTEWYKFRYLYTDIATHTVHVGNFQPAPLVNGKPTNGILFLAGKDGKTIRESRFHGTTCDYENALSFRGVPAGNYQLGLRLYDHDGKLLWHWEDDYRIYPDGPAPWENNRIGEDTAVPAPWTPVMVSDATVRVLGREYDWTDSLFPARIMSKGHPLLAAPIRLTARVDGQDETLTADSVRVVRDGDTAATVTATGKLGPLTVKTISTVEYDGFIWTTLEFSAARRVTVQRLALQIPFAPEAARLRNFADYKLLRTGAMPSEPYRRNAVRTVQQKLVDGLSALLDRRQ